MLGIENPRLGMGIAHLYHEGTPPALTILKYGSVVLSTFTLLCNQSPNLILQNWNPVPSKQ
jgi:hypothetical protein